MHHGLLDVMMLADTVRGQLDIVPTMWYNMSLGEKEVVMRPLRRGPVNKGRSARQFRSKARKSKALNLRGAPMRGGIRL